MSVQSRKEQKQMTARGGIKFAESNTDEIYNETAGIDYITKRTEEVIACYDESIRLDSEVDYVWALKCYSLQKLGKHEETKE